MTSFSRFAAIFASLAGLVAASGARADKIGHPTAVFSGLDKITGRIISFDVATDETVQFGSLQITPRACFSRPATEAPQTDGFVEVDEVQTDNKFKRIFSGWMYAASPGLHGVEHPVYDVWLTDCKGNGQLIADTAAAAQTSSLDAPLPAPTLDPSASPAPKAAAKPRQPVKPPANTAGLPPSDPFATPGPLDPPRPRANVGAQQAGAPPAQRRSPIQSFFPTVAEPGESARDRDLR